MKIVNFLSAVLILCATTIGCGERVQHHRRNFKSWNDLKWESIARQGYDYSCGSASLATLTRGYFGDTWAEPVILTVLVETLPQEEIADRVDKGFSLLDLKRAASILGYNVVGVKLKPEALFKLGGPVIVRLKNGEWEHFVVFRGIHNDRVFIADPARGNMRVPLYEFFNQWDGTALALGKKGFGMPNEYPLALGPNLPKTWPENDAVRKFSPAFGRN